MLAKFLKPGKPYFGAKNLDIWLRLWGDYNDCSSL